MPITRDDLVWTWLDDEDNAYICGIYKYSHTKPGLLMGLIGVFEESGLYIFVKHNPVFNSLLFLPEVLYIGESGNLRNRLLDHTEHDALVENDVTHVHVWPQDLTKSERMLREISLKKRNPPKLNPLSPNFYSSI